MNDDFRMEIPIPTDDLGYVLLQCSHCGTLFKATPEDIMDDRVLTLFCPSCGLTSDNYITEDVLELAITMGQNRAVDMIYDELKRMEKKFKKGPFTIKAGKRPKHTYESPIQSGINALEVTTFRCCKRKAKVKPMLKITGCYCPFCGVKNYEVE